AARRRAFSAFSVNRAAPGVSSGAKEKKPGIRGSPPAEVYFDKGGFPADRLIGAEGEGFSIAMRTLDYSRPTIAAQALGIAQGAFDVAAPYSQSREQFGKPIAELQGIQIMLADMATPIEAPLSLGQRALSL